MFRLSSVVPLLLTVFLPAVAEKPKQMVQFDSVLFVRSAGVTGRTSIVLFDGDTAELLASKVLSPTYGTGEFFPSNSMELIDANSWANAAIRDCPQEQPCVRWRSIGVLKSSKKHQAEFGLGVGGTVGGTYVWVVPVGLSISDVSGVVGFGDSTLKTEKEWKDYTDKWEEAQAKAIEQQKQAAYQAQKEAMQKEADAEAKILAAKQRLHTCLLNLKEGESSSKVYSCGYPDHTNSDLHTDQLIFPDDIIVYINKASDTVENVQWTH